MALKFKGENCIGCKLCQLACSAAHEKEFNPYLARLFVSSRYTGRGRELAVEGRVCTLCGVCVATCPADALTFADGRLLYKPDECISCGSCVEACPEEVITRRDVGIAVCDLCAGTPQCVKWCPHQALVHEEGPDERL